MKPKKIIVNQEERLVSEIRYNAGTRREKFNVAKCTLSLTKAIQDAGGCFESHLLEMTVAELICDVIAQNNVRFIFIKPED